MTLQFEHSVTRPYMTILSGRRDDQSRCPDDAPDDPSRGHLIYSTNGLLVVHSDAGHWVVPPTTMLRLAPGVTYSIRKAEHVLVRDLELSTRVSQRLPIKSGMYRLTPVLRRVLETLSTAADEELNNDGHDRLLVDVLLEAGAWLDDAGAQYMGTPGDPRVAHICDYVSRNLDAPKTLQEWATELKHDTRTLHRLFVHEFGMSFVQWRQQTRLMAALEWLAQGRQVMDVALDLGYQTQSAFAAMFRRNMGITPSEWQEKRRRYATHPPQRSGKIK